MSDGSHVILKRVGHWLCKPSANNDHVVLKGHTTNIKKKKKLLATTRPFMKAQAKHILLFFVLIQAASCKDLVFPIKELSVSVSKGGSSRRLGSDRRTFINSMVLIQPKIHGELIYVPRQGADSGIYLIEMIYGNSVVPTLIDTGSSILAVPATGAIAM